MRCHLREGIYGTGDFPLLHQSSAVPADLRVFPSVSGRKFPYGEIFCRKNAPKARARTRRDSEGENCDRRSACAAKERVCPGPPFHAGNRHETRYEIPFGAAGKARLLPLHCMCGEVHALRLHRHFPLPPTCRPPHTPARPLPSFQAGTV